MALIVQKFGGTSVADMERIASAARLVESEVAKGNKVAVVVSAMAGETNKLVKYISTISPTSDMKEYDTVVAAGEQVTAGLMALELQKSA